MEPLPPRIMVLTLLFRMLKLLSRFTPSTSWNSRSEVVCALFSSTLPTQLATPSSRPCSATTPATQASTCGSRVEQRPLS